MRELRGRATVRRTPDRRLGLQHLRDPTRGCCRLLPGHDALAEHPKVFTPLYVNMIRAGESSGALDVVLGRLADFTESAATSSISSTTLSCALRNGDSK